MATYSSIKYTEISDNSVTTAKIANGAVTVGKLANTLDISSKTITLPNASVTNDMLAGSIDLTSKITGTIPTSNGGLGTTSLGSANQTVQVNSGATALEFATAAAAWEYHYQTQDDVGNIGDNAQIGNSISITPAVSGVVVFSGCFSYRQNGANYNYFGPRQASTVLMTFGHAYAISNTGHNQGFSWSCDAGTVVAGSTYSYNLFNVTTNGTTGNSGDNGPALHMILEIATNYTRN